MKLGNFINNLIKCKDCFEYSAFGDHLNLDIINVSSQGDKLYITYVQDKDTDREHIGCVRVNCEEVNDESNSTVI